MSYALLHFYAFILHYRSHVCMLRCDFTVKLLNFIKLVFLSVDLQIYVTVSNFLNRVKMSCEPFFFYY